MNREQLKTVLWLRLRLMFNQSRRNHGLGMVIAILMSAAAVALAAVSFAGGFLGAFYGLRDARPMTIWMVWLIVTIAFLFFWLFGLLTELQRSEMIDLQKLMHLPVALGQMFIINFLVSHFTLSIVITVPAMVGLALGLVVARGWEMFLLIPLAAGMVFMVSAWTYCLRGWLATLMTNPRRRRSIIMGITLVFILLSQGPNLYFNVFRHDFRPNKTANYAAHEENFQYFLAAQKFIPPLWLPLGAQALGEKNPLPALLGIFGCFVIGALGLRRAYRSAVRFYHGETGGLAAAKIKISDSKKIPAQPSKNRIQFLERRLPFLPEQAGALALATFRSLLRAPEVKMVWASSFISFVILASVFLFRPVPTFGAAKPFLATASVVFSLFVLVQFLTNQFGFDRDGFRALILSPADRRFILLGKNLACLPPALVFGAILLALTAIRLRLPLFIVAATILQFVTLFLIVSIGGNFISIVAPHRITPGSIRPTKTRREIMLLMLLLQSLFLLVVSPVFLPALAEWLWRAEHLPDFVPVNFILSALLCGAIFFIYWKTLAPMGRLLQKRETKILEIVTAEVE